MPIIRVIKWREADGLYEVTLTETSRKKIVNDADTYNSIKDSISLRYPETSTADQGALAEEIIASLQAINKL